MQKQKNILLFTDTPLSGGAELQMFLVAKFLNKEKFKVVVCVGPYITLDKLVKNLENEEIKVIRLPIKHKNDPAQLKLIKKIIEEEKIDLIHINLWNPASGRFAFLAAKKTKIPIVITEHDPFKINFIKNIFKKSTLKYTKKIIAISDDNKHLLKKLYPKFANKTTVIRNGIDITWWKSQFLSFNQSDRENIRHNLFQIPIEQDKKTLVGFTAAELHPRKGIHILLQAIKDLVDETPEKKRNSKFIIAGDGPQRKVLEAFIKRYNLESFIILLGRQKNIPYLMKSADFFILPSIREAFGLVNLEAMISGLPIIATRTGGIPEIIKDGKTGLLVPPKDDKKLKDTIKKIINSKSLRSKLSTNGKKEVEKRFSAEKMAKEYEKVYSVTAGKD
jgi:glycosyltransferase involved in cell wall biosynthesis